MIEDSEIPWTLLSETTATASDYIIGCKCGCENEDECHGDDVCDPAMDKQ